MKNTSITPQTTSTRNIIEFKSLLLIIFISSLTINLNAQIISLFTWETADITRADIGPNFRSSNSSVFSGNSGKDGSKGLNAGLPKRDLNLVLEDNSIFNVAGIDVSFDYQRDESAGTFFSRGNSLRIKGCNRISVIYRVDNGSGGFRTVNSGNVYNIPNDNTFRNYRFVYLPTTGVGTLLVNGTAVWSHDGPNNRNMYWNGAGDIVIGAGMDGSGYNRTFLDNLKIGEVFSSPLPIELVSFEADLTENNEVSLNWETASEVNNSHFSIERSFDSENWKNIEDIDGAGNSNELISYSTVDKNPEEGVSYYRLKQTDYDGKSTYSKIKIVEVSLENKETAFIKLYPNPTVDIINIESNSIGSVRVYNSVGRDVTTSLRELSRTETGVSYSVNRLLEGIYIVKNNDTVARFIKK